MLALVIASQSYLSILGAQAPKALSDEQDLISLQPSSIEQISIHERAAKSVLYVQDRLGT
jgi:hypothetical protein